MEKHNKAFKEKVLKNDMFDDYDKGIIRHHLSNFYCVFQLGFDEGKKQHQAEIKKLQEEIDKRIDVWKEVCTKADTQDRKEGCETIVNVLYDVKKLIKQNSEENDNLS